jgi:hypothetical protein
MKKIWALRCSLFLCSLFILLIFHETKVMGQTISKANDIPYSTFKLTNAKAAFTLNALAQPFLPPNLYTQSFGFFCRQELKLQQVHIPLIFRLGSKSSCDKLEGKNKYGDLSAY